MPRTRSSSTTKSLRKTHIKAESQSPSPAPSHSPPKSQTKRKRNESTKKTTPPASPKAETNDGSADRVKDECKDDNDNDTKMPPLIKTTPHALRMSYRIARGEQGVLTFEPYKSFLLPYWRFRTVPIAEKSSADLWQKFEEFGDQRDFVGMDMARKFIQMGMTRAKRYANHAGGRKYKKGTREELPKSEGHKDKVEKEQASLVFREMWEQCKVHPVYLELKEEFLKEQKQWDKMR